MENSRGDNESAKSLGLENISANLHTTDSAVQWLSDAETFSNTKSDHPN